MAEIQEGGNKKSNSKQKKMTVRVDFTPMVDMKACPAMTRTLPTSNARR